MQLSVKVDTKQLKAQLKKASKLGTVKQRADVLTGALFIVVEASVENLKTWGAWITGTLAGSITQEVQIRGTTVEGRVGSNLEYARRIELGFTGTDSLGRTYNQKERPYLRPAFAKNITKVVDKIVNDLQILLGDLVN